MEIAHIVFTFYYTSSNNANTLCDTISKIKCQLLYGFRFEMILKKSSLLSQKCRQRERTSLRDSLRVFLHDDTLHLLGGFHAS